MKTWNKIVQCATQNPTIVITEVTVKFIKILGHFNIYKEGLIKVCCIESCDFYGQGGKEQYYFSGEARQRLSLLLTQILWISMPQNLQMSKMEISILQLCE